MNEKELLVALSQMMDEKLHPTNSRLDRMEADITTLKEDISTLTSDVSTVKEDVEQIKEDTEITRVTTNALVQWADKAGKEIDIAL